MILTALGREPLAPLSGRTWPKEFRVVTVATEYDLWIPEILNLTIALAYGSDTIGLLAVLVSQSWHDLITTLTSSHCPLDTQEHRNDPLARLVDSNR